MDGLIAAGRAAGVALLVLVGVIAWRWSVGGRPWRPGATARAGRGVLGRVPDTPAVRVLIHRWRARAARWRWGLAAAASLGAIALGATSSGEVGVGIGEGQPWVDPLAAGLLGAFVGSIAAEWHRVRPHGHARPGAAARRSARTDLPPGSRRRLRALALAVAVLTGIGIVVSATVLPGLLGLVVAGVLPVVEDRIVQRPRPDVGSDLAAADAALRRLAVRGVDDAGAGLVLLLGAWQLTGGLAHGASGWPWRVVATAQVAALVAAILWWRRSDPHRLVPDVGWAVGGQVPRSRAPWAES